MKHKASDEGQESAVITAPFIQQAQDVLNRIDTATPQQFADAITGPLTAAVQRGDVGLGKSVASILLGNEDKITHPRAVKEIGPFMSGLVDMGRGQKDADANALGHNVLTKMGEPVAITTSDIAVCKDGGWVLTRDEKPLFIKQDGLDKKLPLLR